jgi:hypothetical protein
MTAYRKRESLLEKAEREWRVEPHALVLRTAEGKEMAYPWRDVSRVRLRYAPTRLKTWRYTFDVAFKNGVDWSIDNAHFASIGDFEDRSATYAPFVRAALARIKAEAPQAKIYTGTSPISFAAQVAMVAVAFLGLAALFLTIPVFETSNVWWVVFKLAIIAAMIPPFVKWVRTNVPRAISPDAIPEDALPNANPPS